jgi:hypothetical protein
MRCFFHGNIRISFNPCPGFAANGPAQHLEVMSLAQDLVYQDAYSEDTFLGLRVDYLAQEHTVCLVDPNQSPSGQRLGQHQTEPASRNIRGAADDRVARRVGQHRHANVLVHFRTCFPSSFHGILIGKTANMFELISPDARHQR